MKEEVFEEILRSVTLPLGELLKDGATYRVTSKDFQKIKTRHKNELESFDKFLVITYNQQVAGGILFYGDTDIQAITFPEYRGQHIMSAIHKNGVLQSECYPNQRTSVSKKAIKSFDDFLMKHYLLSNAGIEISNLSEIYKYLSIFKNSNRFSALQKYSEETFIEEFSQKQ